MNACARVEQRRAARGPTATNASPPLAHLVEQRAQIGQVGHPEQAARIDVERAEQLAARSPRGARAATARRRTGARASSRAAPPSAAAGRGSASSAVAAWARLGATNSSRAGASGSRTGNSYWPSTRPAEEAGDRARLDRQQRAAAARAEPGRARRRAGRPPGRARRASRRRFASIHSGRSTASGGGQRASAREAGVRGDEPLALLRGSGELPERRRVTGGLQVGDAARRPAGEAPVDHAWSAGRGTVARARPGRASRARGDDRRVRQRGRAARRAGRRSAVNATRPPASRTISCAAAASTARQPFSVSHPVEPRGRDLAQRRRRSCRSRAAGARPPPGPSADAQRPSAGRPTRSRPARACRRAQRRSPSVGSSRTPFEPARRRRAARDPLLVRPEVVDEAEHDVGHRRARRRPRSRRSGAAGRAWRSASRRSGRSTTQHAVAAEVDRPALLADRGEARARVVQRARARRTPRPRRPRRSPACGRRPRRACRSRRPARRSWAGRAACVAAHAPTAGTTPSQSVPRPDRGASAPYPTEVPAAHPRPARGRRAPRRPAARPRRRGHRQDDGRSSSASPGWPSTAHAPESLLVLRRSDARGRRAARAARGRASTRPYEELAGHHRSTASARACCTTRRSRPGSTRSPTPVTPADRLAMLLERIDELPLRHHDLRGNPSALLGAIVAPHRPPQGRARLAPTTTRAWAGDAPGRRRRRDARARVRRALRRPRPHARRGRRRSTSATSCSTRSGCCATKPHVRARVADALRATCSSTSCRTRASPRACCCGCSSAEHGSVTAVGRRRPGDPPLPRRRDQEPRATSSAEWPRRDGRAAGGVAPLPGSAILARRARGRRADRGPARRRR